VHDKEGEADSIVQVQDCHADANEKSGSGSMPTRGATNLCPVGPGSLVKRVHDEEGEADSIDQVRPSDLVGSGEWEADYHDLRQRCKSNR
jgi:hypothetical protein